MISTIVGQPPPITAPQQRLRCHAAKPQEAEFLLNILNNCSVGSDMELLVLAWVLESHFVYRPPCPRLSVDIINLGVWRTLLDRSLNSSRQFRELNSNTVSLSAGPLIEPRFRLHNGPILCHVELRII